MDAFLNVTLKLLAFGDKTISSNPRLKYVDWTRDVSGSICRDPKAKAYSIDPGATQQIFSGVRATAISNTAQFSLTLSPLDPSRYRLTWTSGVAPGFRTDRALTLNTIAVTLAVLANNTVTMSVPGPSASNFAAVVAGDTIFIPGAISGDSAGPFSPLNTGFWTVLAVNSTASLTLARPTGTAFQGASETVTVTANSQLQAFGAVGVQVGDKVDITAGFAQVAWKTFDIIAVTSTFVEFMSTSALPTQTGIVPTTAGMVFFTDSKQVLYIEVDQEAALQFNGSTDLTNRLSPTEAGNPDRPGYTLKRGPTWSLSIVNRSPVTMNALVVDAE